MPSKTPIVNAGQVIVRRGTDGKYLILRSSFWPERPDRSEKPDLPGGEMNSGETPEQGAVRELLEETGIEAASEDLQQVYVLTYFSERENISLNRTIYFLELADDPQITLSQEHIEYMWLTLNELLALEGIRPPYPEIFRYLHKIGLLV